MDGGKTPLLYDWANKPAPSDTSFAPVTNRPAQALYTQGSNANQGGLLVLGSDYAATPKAQVPRIDANGNMATMSAVAVTAGTTLSPAQQMGSLSMGLSSSVVTPLQIDALQGLVTADNVQPTFAAVAAGVSISTGKSMFALVNNSTAGKVLRIAALYAVNTSTTTATLGNTYNIYAAELRPITGVSTAGTAVTVVPHDTSDVLDANVKAYSGSTVSGDNVGPLRRWATSSYGLTTNATNAEAQNFEQQGRFPWVGPLASTAKYITVRPGNGVHVKIASTATVGFLDITCIFTQANA